MAVGLAGGIPVGGSVSGTALVRSCGAQSRWANIFTGLFGLVVVLLFAPLVELIPLAALAGLLVTVGAGMVNLPRMRTVWHTGLVPLAIMVITFVATLFTPIQVAVALGVVLHFLLYVFRSAEAVRIERIVPGEDGTFSEGEVPEELTSGEIVVLQPIGSLFFAGVAELEEHLPKVGQAQGSAVIIRLRDRDEVGSTFIRTIQRYTDTLKAGGNLLMLEGLSEKVLEQLERTDLLDLIGEENVFLGQKQHGASLRQALAAAEAWLAQQAEDQEVSSA
jgi:SulP family sulfate permease